jgi:hypothetical protein
MRFVGKRNQFPKTLYRRSVQKKEDKSHKKDKIRGRRNGCTIV